MTATIFPVQTVFGFYILAVMLRFLLQCVRADFYNPLVQFLVRITNLPLLPLRRIIPCYRGLDLASVLLAFALQLVEAMLIILLLNQRQRRWRLAADRGGAVQATDQYLLVGHRDSSGAELV